MQAKGSDYNFPPYGIASWRGNSDQKNESGTGFVLLRNPRNQAQTAPEFTLAAALELPATLAEKDFIVEVVRRIVPTSGDPQLVCSNLGAEAQGVSPERCRVKGSTKLQVHMEPTEV